MIDAQRLVPVDTVDLTDLGFAPAARPHHIAVEPDGSFWYVSLIGENRVLKFDRANRLVGQAPFAQAGMLALDPTRDVLVVTRSMTAVNPRPRVGLIRRSDMSIEEVEVLFPRPHAVAVGPAGAYAYVGSLAENRIASVALDAQTVGLTAVDGPPHAFVQFAVSPVAPILVATTELSGRLLAFDITDPAAPRLRASVEVGATPWDPVFTPDGRYVFFGNYRANTVTVVETAGWTVAKVIRGAGLAEPYGSAVSPDGRYVFIANRHVTASAGGAHATHSAHAAGDPGRTATVVVIDTRSLEIARVFDVPGDATGLGIPAPPRR
ncbi:MAG: lactonase family protein [Gemmatimonadales bacterium]